MGYRTRAAMQKDAQVVGRIRLQLTLHVKQPQDEPLGHGLGNRWERGLV